MNAFRTLIAKIKDGSYRHVLRELGFIFRCSRNHRCAVLFYTALGLLSTAMSLGAGILSKHIIDAVTGYNSPALLPLAVFYVAMQLFRIGFNALSGRISADIRLRVDQQLRGEVYDRVMNGQWESLAEFHSGDILNRVDNDVAAVAGSVLSWLPDLITRCAQLLGTLLIILRYDATLALLALLSAPVTMLVSGAVLPRLRSHNKTLRSLSSRLMAFNEESFQNVQPIKALGLADSYSRRLRQVQGDFHAASMDYNRLHVGTNALLSLVGTVVTMVCFGWGVYRLWSGHITYGTMTLFLQMSTSLSGAFSALVYLFPGIIAAATAAGRILTIIDLPQEDDSARAEAEKLARTSPGGITVVGEGVSFAYRKGQKVLENASFRAEPSQVVALVGASGEGKTTLLRLILGLVEPQAGEIRAEGSFSLPVSPGTRSLFAYVPQRCTLFSGTVAQNLRLVKPDATDEELWEVLRLACAENFVKRQTLGLDEPVQEQGGGFSQGQIQRLMIARALLLRSPVLLLDEATSALDPKTEKQVLENIMRHAGGRTCIITTHRPTVLKMCRRVYRVAGGQLHKLSADERKELEEKEENHG